MEGLNQKGGYKKMPGKTGHLDIVKWAESGIN